MAEDDSKTDASVRKIILGGWQFTPADENAKKAVIAVKDDVFKKITDEGFNPGDKYDPTDGAWYQMVAGINYCVTVEMDRKFYGHIRVFVGLNNAKPELSGFIINKSIKHVLPRAGQFSIDFHNADPNYLQIYNLSDLTEIQAICDQEKDEILKKIGAGKGDFSMFNVIHAVQQAPYGRWWVQIRVGATPYVWQNIYAYITCKWNFKLSKYEYTIEHACPWAYPTGVPTSTQR